MAKHVTAPQVRDMRLMRACGLSIPAIVKALGVSKDSVKRHAKGVALYGPARPATPSLARILALRLDESLSIDAIADEVGLTPASVWRHVKRFSFRAPPKPAAARDPKRVRQLLAAHAAGVGGKALAERFGYASATCAWSTVYVIKRKMKEAA